MRVQACLYMCSMCVKALLMSRNPPSGRGMLVLIVMIMINVLSLHIYGQKNCVLGKNIFTTIYSIFSSSFLL